MSDRTSPLLLLAFACAFALPGVAYAAWIPNGTPVATGALSQELPVALPDGAGGAYIAYLDGASGTLRPYLKRIGSDGVLDGAYGAGGVALGKATGPNTTMGPVIADGPGGTLYVAWKDDSVRVQRMLGTSHALGWPLAGVALCRNELAFSQYFNLKLAVDGTGAAHVFWDVNFDALGNSVAHATVTPAAGIAFRDCLGNGCGTDRYAGFLAVAGGQVVSTYSASGTSGGNPANDIVVTWSPLGVSRSIDDNLYGCLAPAMRFGGAVAPSLGDHVIVAFRGGTAQRFSPDGAVTAQWLPVAGPLLLATPAFEHHPLAGVSDGAGGALFVFTDTREALPGPGLTVQAVNALGTVPGGWPADGAFVVPGAGFPQLGGAAPDGASGIVLGWSRQVGSDIALHAQRVRAGGAIDPGWPAAGAPVSTIAGAKYLSSVVSDGFGGVLLLWQDRRGGDNDVYAMRVSASGLVAPVVAVPPSAPAATGVRLSSGLPNPTRGAASFTLELPQDAAVRARVVSLAGRDVAALLRGAVLPAGPHVLRWDGRDSAGLAAAPGIYFLEVTVGGQRIGRRIVRLP